MQKHATFALLGLLVAAPLHAQRGYDENPPLAIRWHFSFGPTTAKASGRTTKLPDPSQCFSCPTTEEVVSGADHGAYNFALGASGIPGQLGIAMRLELMVNSNTSDPYVAPPKTCVKLKCSQPRKAEIDKAFMLAGALEYSPLDKKMIAPYVVVGGGLDLNRLNWRQDSSTTSALSGKAVAFGPFASVGGGVRAAYRQWAAFIEWRQFTTFVTPGSQMAPLSVGVQYRAKKFGVGA